MFAILLIYRLVDFIPWGSSDKNSIKALYQDGQVTEYAIDQNMKMDGDFFTLKTLYITPKQVVIRYSLRRQDPDGWSFPGAAIKLFDSSGKELTQHSSGSDGRAWGETGFIYFDPAKQPQQRFTLKYEWYDRHAELQIPLAKDGEGE